jgi:hypothetical protein
MTERVQGPATAPAYLRFKDDGWPLCPGCGDDELWSPAVPATVDTIASCLNCNWRPGSPVAPEGGPRCLSARRSKPS